MPVKNQNLDKMKFRRLFERIFKEEPSGLAQNRRDFKIQLSGVSVGDLNAAKRSRYFGKIVPADYDKTALLHYENLQSGSLIKIRAGTKCSKPLHLGKDAGDHKLIVVETDCEVTFVDVNGSLLGCTEIYVHKGAKVNFVWINQNQNTALGVHRAVIESNAKINWFVATLNCEKIYSTVQSHVAGAGGESNIEWVFRGSRQQKYDLMGGNIFDAPDCAGEILCKGVVSDHGRVAFKGEIDITLDGGGTDSYLKEDVLMLDPQSRIDAIPSLEIKTNDVKAGHGVAISRLTDERLFYLMSRGLSREQARELTVDGFLRDSYSRFPSDPLVSKVFKDV